MTELVSSGNEADTLDLLAEDVTLHPPSYSSSWKGRDVVAAVLTHVNTVFSDFSYRRILGEG